MKAHLLYGTVVFTESGKTFSWSSRGEPPSTTEHPFELRDDGIVIQTARGPELVAFEAIESINGWSPVEGSDLNRNLNPLPRGLIPGATTERPGRSPHETPHTPTEAQAVRTRLTQVVPPEEKADV